MIQVKSEQEIEKMSRACSIVAHTLKSLEEMVAPGVSTLNLEDRAEEVIAASGGKPAFKGYRGYPACICASVNDQVVHGIPSAGTVLGEGEIIRIDLGVIHEGFYGDAAITVPVGPLEELSPEARMLLEVTRGALEVALPKAREGGRVSDRQWRDLVQVLRHSARKIDD